MPLSKRLSEMSEDDREILLIIIRAVLNVLQSGLYNLGIPVVERMGSNNFILFVMSKRIKNESFLKTIGY